MSITSIKDAIKAIAQSLQLSTIIPALIFVMFNTLFIVPTMWPSIDWALSKDVVVTGIIFTTVTLSYLLYAFNYPLIRFIEGYVGWNNFLLKPLKEAKISKYKEQFKKLISERAGLYCDDMQLFKKGQEANQKLDTYFPCEAEYILPTRLGNAIIAFEHYPKTRYGIDAVAVWPRLIPVLQKNDYLEFVSQQKSIFDFLLNLLYVVFVCGFELIYLFCYLNFLNYALITASVTCVLSILLYIGIINGALQWGLSIRVAFDLYRDELWDLLRLKQAENYQEEVERWGQISDLIMMFKRSVDVDIDFNSFAYTNATKNSTLSSGCFKKVFAGILLNYFNIWKKLFS